MTFTGARLTRTSRIVVQGKLVFPYHCLNDCYIKAYQHEGIHDQ